MRNFHRISQGIDTIPLMNALIRQPELWNAETCRTSFSGSPHTSVDDILLRFNDLEPYRRISPDGKTMSEYVGAVNDEHESICHPAWGKLLECHSIVFDLMHYLKAFRLGRILITRLPAGKIINPHKDGDAHAEYYERYHIILQNNPGSIFKCGDEQVQMCAGEIWWFQNAIEHSVLNYSNDDRLTMIVDLRLK